MRFAIPDDATLQSQYQTAIQDETNLFLLDRVAGGSTKPSIEAFEKPENNVKNRRADVPCWDHSRVNLSNVDSTAANDSTYIHANYVDAFSTERKFIATQAPMAQTVDDFLDMIWQNNCGNIVVLTKMVENNEEKCYPYWSTDMGDKKSEKYTVTTIEIEEIDDYTKYTLQLENRKVAKDFPLISLYHYTHWSENGVPADGEPTVYQFAGLVTAINIEYDEYCYCGGKFAGPIVVHGSAGAGRTGTFCAINYCVDQYLRTKNVDVLRAVQRMRSMRHSSVMNADQYKFIFCVLKSFIEDFARFVA
ncbi:GfV-C8-ORF1 [Ichnoviriform fumiferanae]|uniref:GfV-C8-ORF1 n=1 Tax=Ichnoviriform fumiferanae TaxID=419435 RepID=A2PZX3_9VIRU|nr:GfV-C8-ORF1 [Ichnoviriform fumiferanae]BAF45545.1 GfV-C8-ORF1 [Ichnoviriform fumiferanae]